MSDLAVAVNAQRPSVSRSLKTLRNDQLVERRRDGWALTLAGGEEAERLNEELSLKIDGLRDAFMGTTTLQLTKALNPIPKPLLKGLVPNYIASNSIGVLNGITSSLVPKILDQKYTPIFADRISLSIAPLIDTQRIFSGAIAQAVAVPTIGIPAFQTNALIAKAVEDIQAVRFTPTIRLHGFDKALYPGVLSDIQHIAFPTARC